ncbi:hypothetical protein FRC18_007264 [Serendipita sp. 400]|nr:hypothetical protein FRC18_007264 [Serendipita sp. 400]
MRFLTNDSLHDNRPPKRRRIDFRAAVLNVANNNRSSSSKSTSLQNQNCLMLCSICNQLSGCYFSCPSCQTICCEGCSSYCDADLLGIQQPPTPPLLEDDDSAFGSTPSTPNRYSTPESFDPQLLRARLASAAGLPTAASTSTPIGNVPSLLFNNESSQQPNQYQPPGQYGHEPSSSRQLQQLDHHHHHLHYLQTGADDSHNLALGSVTTPLGGLAHIISQHSHMNMHVQTRPGLHQHQHQQQPQQQLQQQQQQQHQHQQPPQLHLATSSNMLAGTCVQQKKRKRTSCGEGGIDSSTRNSTTISTTKAVPFGRPSVSAASRQHQNACLHWEARSCSLSSNTAQCYQCLYENGNNGPITASSLDGGYGDSDSDGVDRDLHQPQPGCTSRFCTNCLVQTADGYKICVPCLEECYPA